jgi:DNA-directed RNA polymerases I, II, and III subunit RPABC2
MDEVDDQISDGSLSDGNDDVLEINYNIPDNLSGDEWDDDDDDDDDDDVDELEDMTNLSKFQIISNNETYDTFQTQTRKTRPYLSRFEKAKVLGLRAAQIDNGCESTLAIPPNLMDARSIAEYEFQNQGIPFMIRRYFVDGTHEDWRLSELVELET